jgi:hypothetical protein
MHCIALHRSATPMSPHPHPRPLSLSLSCRLAVLSLSLWCISDTWTWSLCVQAAIPCPAGQKEGEAKKEAGRERGNSSRGILHETHYEEEALSISLPFAFPPFYPGTFLSQGVCTPCAPGSYTSVPGSSACALCPRGENARQRQDWLEESVAVWELEKHCQPGQRGSQSSRCALFCCLLSISTPSGSFNSASNNTYCTSCAAGDFCSGSGCASCSPCGAGTYSQVGAASCSNCPAGSYSAYARSTSCSLCAPGSSNAIPGSSACTACRVGSFQAQAGGRSCTVSIQRDRHKRHEAGKEH